MHQVPQHAGGTGLNAAALGEARSLFRAERYGPDHPGVRKLLATDTDGTAR